MPVRGKRPIWPKEGGKPTGIFKQPQKLDSTADLPAQKVRNYANPQPAADKIGHTLMKATKMKQSKGTPQSRNGWK